MEPSKLLKIPTQFLLEDTVISLTSIPRRFNTCLPKVIQDIKRQSVQCKVIVNIPLEYKKWKGEVVVPEWLIKDDNIIIHRTTKDYGPSTKLIGALEYIKNIDNNIKYIITIDDDMEYYDESHIEKLKNVSNSIPNCVITYGGIKLTAYPYSCLEGGLTYNNQGFVDAPAGLFGVVYPVKPFYDNFYLFKDDFISTLPSGIFNDDDAFFGIISSMINTKIYSCYGDIELRMRDYDSGGSGVVEFASKCRVKNESEIYQYAVEKGYLLNKSVL